jgi:hypothetical protein
VNQALANPDVFDAEALLRFDNRVASLNALWWKLILLQFALSMVLLSTLLNFKFQLNLFDLSLSPDSVAREIILLISAHVGLAMAGLGIHANVLQLAARKIRDARSKTGAELVGLDRWTMGEVILEIVKAYTTEALGGFSRIAGAAIILGSFSFFLIGFVITVIVSGVIHVNIMIDIWNKPGLGQPWSHWTVIYCIALDFGAFALAMFTEVLPMQYLDLEKIAKVAKENAKK